MIVRVGGGFGLLGFQLVITVTSALGEKEGYTMVSLNMSGVARNANATSLRSITGPIRAFVLFVPASEREVDLTSTALLYVTPSFNEDLAIAAIFVYSRTHHFDQVSGIELALGHLLWRTCIYSPHTLCSITSLLLSPSTGTSSTMTHGPCKSLKIEMACTDEESNRDVVATIDILPDNIFLEIFSICLSNPYEHPS
ncbi:hypothetical protein EDB92DRAFT_1887339 [Lactarius akahatsu]|uniref:Uncharacterized protein n=1 Tax=Lactarius akahatsu TaxID=416441 RepID=A0AAD4QA49_9AGAM|nr:hypothetical protein EDB92DRAFT_1887339 [Lactarius akahatsu]